jgi:hypothetical protein
MARPKSESGPKVDEQEIAFERLKKKYALKNVELVISSANPSDRWGEYRQPEYSGRGTPRVVLFRNKINKDVLENNNYGSKRTLLARLNAVVGHEINHARGMDHGPEMGNQDSKTIKFIVGNKPRMGRGKVAESERTGSGTRDRKSTFKPKASVARPNATPRPRPTATPKPKG